MGADVEALPNHGMKAQFRFLRNLAPWLIIAATFLGNGGILCWFSYISPLLQTEGGFSPASISLLMILAGGGMVVGNQVSALLADRLMPGRFTCYLQFWRRQPSCSPSSSPPLVGSRWC